MTININVGGHFDYKYTIKGEINLPIISTGQITIVDYNDAVSLSGYIGANQALTQVYNPDNATYTPNYPTANLILTPSLFTSLTGGTDVIATTAVKSIKWFDAGTEVTNGATYTYPVFTSGQNRLLTVKLNIMAGAVMAKTFLCEIVYTDAVTASDLTYKTSITINRINNGGGVTIAQVTTPSGMVFKNGGGTSLTAKAELLRASGLDTTNNTYTWQKMITGVWTTLITGNALGATGFATDTLTIPATAVVGLVMFRCNIVDNDSASPTFNQTFTASCTIVDQTDPIQVNITSSAGDVLKNGVGSTTLTAKLFQAGAEIDVAGVAYPYKWYKANQTGTPDANFGGAGIAFKTGKTLAVGGADVDVKAIFTVEVG